jgi:oligopeptide/dipeptide ABC transporter ATP-binding protein
METDRGTLQEIPGSIPNLLDPPPGCRYHPRCPYAMDICRCEPEPAMRPSPEGALVACHLYGAGGQPIRPLAEMEQPSAS